MNLELITRKNNALTDGCIPDRKVIANKLLNVINYKYEQEGTEFKIAINDLANLMGITSNSGKTKAMIADGIKILQQPIELKNFEYKGRGIKWIIAPFLSEVTAYTDDKNYINIKLNDKIITGLKATEQYTAIDINISNKFKTKYGIVIWEMYLRYKNQPRQGIEKDLTYQLFTMEELNKKFGTKYKYISDLQKCIDRGTTEIKKITEKDIIVTYQKDIKSFSFVWKIETKELAYETEEKELIKKIRKDLVNTPLLAINGFEDYSPFQVACSDKGKLYSINTNADFTAKQSNKLWRHLFHNQSQIISLKQGTFDI